MYDICKYMYVRTYVCMCVRTYVCMYVCMCVRTYVCMYACVYVCMCVHMHVCMYVCRVGIQLFKHVGTERCSDNCNHRKCVTKH